MANKLFTPGPLTTSSKVKQAMLHDMGSRDETFSSITHELREQLISVNQTPKTDYTTILLPGSGTYGIEAALTSISQPKSHWLIITNGAYGKRMMKILECHNIKHDPLNFNENEPSCLETIDSFLNKHKTITHIACVHCETSSGLINNIQAIGELTKKHNKCFVVDAMSTFGGVPISIENSAIDLLISSPNKCLESVPGFSFIIIRKERLTECKSSPKIYSLDLHSHWKSQEETGQFLFTPPVQSILACKTALTELHAEGGVAGRAKRYRKNNDTLIQGMEKNQIATYLPRNLRGYIITSFIPPKLNFSFQSFYNYLRNHEFIIYPGNLTNADTFRIGNIGAINQIDIEELVESIDNFFKYPTLP